MKDRKIQNAWRRFFNDSYTCEDLQIILNSLKDDEDLREFYETSEQEWICAQEVAAFDTETDRQRYREQAAKLLTEYNRTHPKHVHFATQKSFGIVYRWTVAAVFALGLTVGAYYYFSKPSIEIEKQQAIINYVEASTGRGEVKTLFLPDNTKVTLNAESRVKYPDAFASDIRLIELQGEAIFDVVPAVDLPFVVKTKLTEVKVLGTVFDVKAYDDDELLLISVASGKVAVEMANTQTQLKTNEQLRFTKSTGKQEVLSVEAGKYLSWVEGKLYFFRTPIREVVNMLNRRYPQVYIQLVKGNYTNLISGEHDNKSLEAVLKSIAYSTGLKYKKTENNTMLLYKE